MHISYLNDNAIFNKDSLRNFLNTVSVRQADSSKAVFLKGIDLLKNGKQAAAAISAFIESLTIYPAANTYYELGNAFLQTKKWPSALQSFEMAESLDFSPLGSVLFKMASCYAEMDSTEKMYEKSTNEYGFENNKVISRSLVATQQFAIDAKGKIISTQQS